MRFKPTEYVGGEESDTACRRISTGRKYNGCIAKMDGAKYASANAR